MTNVTDRPLKTPLFNAAAERIRADAELEAEIAEAAMAERLAEAEDYRLYSGHGADEPDPPEGFEPEEDESDEEDFEGPEFSG